MVSFILVMRTLEIYSPNNLTVYHTLVLTTVIMLCISFIALTSLVTGICTF